MQTQIKNYWDKGFIIKKKLLSDKYCENIKKYIDKKKSNIFIPFSKTPWGYGNLVNDSFFSTILENKFITKFAKSIFKNEYDFNHLTINNKAAWIGPDVELHQEVFNMKTYAPGCNSKRDWKRFFQVFISLDDQTSENGCLKIIPYSHKLGELKHVDIIGPNLGHKRRVNLNDMNKAYKKFGLKNVLLKKGDALIFNHLLIHGSTNNISPISRKAIVLQLRDKSIKKNMGVFDKETKYRKKFVENFLIDKVKEISKKNQYKDFLKRK